MKTKKNSIVKEGFKGAHKKFVILSLPLSFFALITIGIFVLGFIAPFTLVLTIPFIVIPGFFAISAINTIALNKNTHEGLGFFVMFRAYFSPVFRGGYKVVIGLVKFLLSYLIVSVILSTVLASTILSKDPEYIAFVQKLNSITDANQILELTNNFINTNVTFQNIMVTVNAVGTFFGCYMFLHHFAVNSFKYNYNFSTKLPLPMHDLNLIAKNVHKQNMKRFYKSYYKAFWFLGLILAIGYASGVIISYFFIKMDFVQMSVIGMFTAFIFGLFFIPYFLNASQIIFQDYRSLYVENLIDLTKQSIDELKKTQTITEDKEKEILKIIESQRNDDSKIDNNKDKE